MPLQTACSSCSAKIKVKDELVGRSIKCPKCGKVFKALADEDNAAVKAGAASKSPPKKPAEWDKDDDNDEEEDEDKSAPWDKKAKTKNGKDDKKKLTKKPKSREDDDDDTPKAKSKVKAKAKAKAKSNKRDDDDDDEDDGDDDDRSERAFGELLAQTELPDTTKKMVKNELSLRENGVWVGQPDMKIMTVRALGKAIGAGFGVSVLCLFVGIAGGLALEKNWYFAAAGAVLVWLLLAPAIGFGIILMDRKKTRATAYVITNKRCIVFTGKWFGAPSQESFYPDLIQHMRTLGSWIFKDNAGDIVFRSVTTVTTTHHQRGGTSTSVSTTYFGFLGIRNMDEIERMIRETLLRDDDDDDDD